MNKHEARLAKAAEDLARQEDRVEPVQEDVPDGSSDEAAAPAGVSPPSGSVNDLEGLLRRAKALLDKADSQERAAQSDREAASQAASRAREEAQRAATDLSAAAEATAELRRLEQDARSGFAKERLHMLDRVSSESQRMWEELESRTTDLLHTLDAHSAAAQAELGTIVVQHQEALTKRIEAASDHEVARTEVLTMKSEAERALARVAIREKALDKEVRDRLAAATVETAATADLAARSAATWKSLCHALQEEVDRLEERLGAAGPSRDLQRRLEAVEQQRDDLYAELELRPPLVETESIGSLKDDNAALRQQLAEERSRRTSAESRLHRTDVAVADLELARDRIESLTSIGEAYRRELESATGELEKLTSTGTGGPAFNACTDMDEDPALTDVEPTREAPLLKDLVSEAIARMAALDPPLYFDTSTVATVLAGMASSRLHVLEGISGTGKTSLPVALAEVLGGHCQVVEVASGWRDQQDLVGFYNAFERRFVERPFLRALYKAGSPRFADRLSFMVLDEMNLSHPEQYFSTLLSLLENDRNAQMLELVTTEVAGLPRLMRHHEKGTSLPLPSNVWFIGTANQDETTVALADKTYDRAHVMTLPPPPPPSDGRVKAPPRPISLESLRKRFADADASHGSRSEDVMSLLDDGLAAVLRRDFEVGWGSRLQRQVRAYVPVFAACEGDVRVAADHMFATKVLRKVKNRYDVPVKRYESLRDDLADMWDLYLGAGAPPTQSLELLEREITRLTPRA